MKNTLYNKQQERMPYEKNKPLTQEENELWEKLVAQCKKVNEALDKGYEIGRAHV